MAGEIRYVPARFPTIVARGRLTGQTGAVPSLVTVTPAMDGTFQISANVLATTATTQAFNVDVAWTDEGNTARQMHLPFYNITGGFTVVTANGVASPFTGMPVLIRAKANTAITLLTAGTFTTVTYNVEGVIVQVA